MMIDLDITKNWRILVAIAEGERFQTLVKSHPRLTPEEYGKYERFVLDCQNQRRRAWKRWTLGDQMTLRKLFREGAPLNQIARLLGRSPNALRIRLRRMGLLPVRNDARAQRRAS
jgi:hypothetical protein